MCQEHGLDIYPHVFDMLTPQDVSTCHSVAKEMPAGVFKVHRFKAMGEFKLWLQCENVQFGSKLALFVPCDIKIWHMSLKKPPKHPFYYTSSFVHHFVAVGEFKLELNS